MHHPSQSIHTDLSLEYDNATKSEGTILIKNLSKNLMFDFWMSKLFKSIWSSALQYTSFVKFFCLKYTISFGEAFGGTRLKALIDGK